MIPRVASCNLLDQEPYETQFVHIMLGNKGWFEASASGMSCGLLTATGQSLAQA